MRSRIFVDRDKLSPRYVPPRLPHREKQVELLYSMFSEIGEGREIAYTRVVQLVGPVGTGKTSSCMLVGKRLEEEARKYALELVHVYFNLRLEASSRYLFYKSFAEKLSANLASRSLSAEEQLELIVDYIRKSGMYVLLTLDEADVLAKRRDLGIVYDLTRLGEVWCDAPAGIIGVIVVTRSKDWRKTLDRAERSSLGQLIIEYPKYTREQLVDILGFRAAEAIRRGCLGENVLEFIAEITRDRADGDVRYALDLLLYSGILAENEGAGKITINHVRRALRCISAGLFSEDLEGLNERERAVLFSVLRALKSTGKPYVPFSAVKFHYEVLCEEYGLERMGEEELEEILQSLIDIGVVNARGVAKIGIVDTDIDELEETLSREIARARGEEEY